MGKGQLISIMKKYGTHIRDKDPILKRCAEFYEELYRLRRASAEKDSHDDTTMSSAVDPPSILPSEVEASIKKTNAQQSNGGG